MSAGRWPNTVASPSCCWFRFSCRYSPSLRRDSRVRRPAMMVVAQRPIIGVMGFLAPPTLPGRAISHPRERSQFKRSRPLVGGGADSGLGKAIQYMLRHWEPLTLFLREPGAPLRYAGPQTQFAGLDQVNVLLPRVLAGTG